LSKKKRLRVEFAYEDFVRYVGNCVVRVKFPDKPDFTVGRVNPPTRTQMGRHVVELSTLDEGTFLIKPTDPDIEWNLDTPSKRLFNHEGEMYYMWRRDVRQWHRGLSTGTCMLSQPTAMFYNVVGVRKPAPNINDINLCGSVFSGNYPAFDDAIRSIMRPDLMEVAVSQTFGISQSVDDNPQPLLWHYDKIIGRVSPDTRTVHGVSELAQEVTDFLKRKAEGWSLSQS